MVTLAACRRSALIIPIRANIVGPVMLGNQQQRLHGGLPVRGIVFGLRKKLGDIERGVARPNIPNGEPA